MNAAPWVGLLCCVFAVGCSSTTETTSSPTDASVDGKPTDARPDSRPAPVSDTSSDIGSIIEEQPIGGPCSSDAECDPRELGTSFCSTTGFTSGSLYPTPVCFAVECDAGDGSKIMGCAKDTGICLMTSSSGICLPVCEFDDTGAAAKGCAGKNKCNVYGWGKDSSTMAVVGVGYCFGGCMADADCPTGNSCQVEDGLCVKKKVTYTKTPGTACTSADSGSSTTPATCNCLYTTAEKAGYCANTCYFGVSTCGTGFTCDPGLPKTKIRDTDEVFTKAPTGMAGYCLKNCASDADCTGLNAYCDENAGTGQKTCQIGKRPCINDPQCPSPQTCMGATATALGRCG